MNEKDFKAACDVIRETCSQMSDHQIATLIGLVVHDQDTRKSTRPTEAPAKP